MVAAGAVACEGRLKPAPTPRLMFALKSEVDRTPTETDRIEQRAIAATKSGDSAAYDYLVSKYMKRVVSIAWGIVRNSHDAEDLAQEAFVKAFQTIQRFKPGEPFGPWIYRIVTNLALDVMKHRQRFRHEEIQDSLPAARGDRADLPAVANELARWLRPIAPSFVMLALVASLSVTWVERRETSNGNELVASNSVEITVDGDTYSLGQ